MADAALVLHPAVKDSLRRLQDRLVHAVLLVGPGGSGKLSIARNFVSQVLSLSEDKLDDYPYIRHISPQDGKAIPIESIRELQHFLSLKIPGTAPIARAVIIQDAQLLTTEAQNALLKTLEEPPSDTLIVLTATTMEAMLPTIQSRVRTVRIFPPSEDVLKVHFHDSGFKQVEIEKALLISGGLPGLAQAILTNQESHPMLAATKQSRALLKASSYERLLSVDSLSKNKQLCLDTCFILGEMARMALKRSQGAPSSANVRWKQILSASFRAQELLQGNAQVKLVLINLMLAI